MAAKYQLPVIFIIINNASYAAIKASLIRYRGKAVEKDIFFGSDIGGPEYATIAKGFGVSAFKVASKLDLPRLTEAIEDGDEPLLIDFVIDPMDLGRTVK
jgi:benzoylformate decarboxylase